MDEKDKNSEKPSDPRRNPDEELTPEELAEIKRRMKNPGRRYTTAELLAWLDSKKST